MTAEYLAPRFGASAVSTGDSLSQAASQTLWNIAVFDSGSSLPILRPLLSYDKEEVVGLARRIGTYGLSLEEYKDCCAIITRHPRTRAKAAKIAEYAEGLGFVDLISRSLESANLASYSPKNDEMKSLPCPSLSRGQLPAPPSSRHETPHVGPRTSAFLGGLLACHHIASPRGQRPTSAKPEDGNREERRDFETSGRLALFVRSCVAVAFQDMSALREGEAPRRKRSIPERKQPHGFGLSVEWNRASEGLAEIQTIE